MAKPTKKKQTRKLTPQIILATKQLSLPPASKRQKETWNNYFRKLSSNITRKIHDNLDRVNRTVYDKVFINKVVKAVIFTFAYSEHVRYKRMKFAIGISISDRVYYFIAEQTSKYLVDAIEKHGINSNVAMAIKTMLYLNPHMNVWNISSDVYSALFAGEAKQHAEVVSQKKSKKSVKLAKSLEKAIRPSAVAQLFESIRDVVRSELSVVVATESVMSPKMTEDLTTLQINLVEQATAGKLPSNEIKKIHVLNNEENIARLKQIDKVVSNEVFYNEMDMAMKIGIQHYHEIARRGQYLLKRDIENVVNVPNVIAGFFQRKYMELL